jgi:ankyrin repeat protein
MQEIGMDLHYYDSQARLFEACASGDMAGLRSLLCMGIDPNCCDANGMSPLLTAIYHDHAKLARFLLYHGAELGEVLEEDGSELHIMVWIQHLPRISRLLRRGVPLGLRDEEGRSVLLLAALRGNERILRMLLEREAPLNMADHDGNTALSAAAQRGDLRNVELLLRYGAEVEGSPYHRQTPLQLASDPHVRALLRQYGAQTHACWQKVG